MPTTDESRQSIWIHAFRGKRDDPLFVDRCRGRVLPRPSLQECLVYAGHAGVSFDAERPIYGLLPAALGVEPYVLLDLLQQGSILTGEVADHTAIFDDAATRGCQIVSVEYRYLTATQQAILSKVQSQIAKCTLKYSFPGQGGDCNCATWLGRIGLDLPETTGQMRLFVRALDLLKTDSPVVVG